MIFSLISNIEKIDIILASASPRRYEILQSLGLLFKVVPSGINEDEVDTENPIQYVRHYAEKKGRAVAGKYQDALVISADTVVTLDTHIMGKPRDEYHAFEMLSKLSGKKHQVYTSYALLIKKYDKCLVNHTVTDVLFRNLTEEEIWAYINTGEPADKAGAYAIQGQGALLIEGIDGCFFNVVGFPVSRFFIDLDRFLKDLVL